MGNMYECDACGSKVGFEDVVEYYNKNAPVGEEYEIRCSRCVPKGYYCDEVDEEEGGTMCVEG